MTTVNLAQSELALQQKSLFEVTQARAQELDEQFIRDTLPDGFIFIEDDLYYQEKPNSKGDLPPIFISSRVDVTAIVRDHVNESYGRLLAFKDVDGHLHSWSMPMELLAGDGKEYLQVLLSKGLIIAPDFKSKKKLAEYIQLCRPQKRARCVSKTGWYEDNFVFPDSSVGLSDREMLIYQSMSNSGFGYGEAGTLDEWKNTAKLCIGNSRLVFAVSAAFAPPLLHLLGEESGGFHFRGQSSTGKTTALILASSVWGGKDFIQPWRATTNGLEGIAAAHNDALLCLDEIEQMHAPDMGGSAYLLANGIGKNRSDQCGFARKKSSWRLVFLSTGEISLAEHIAQGGKKIRAGQEIRIIDIPADTGFYGIFENLHGFENGSVFSEHLRGSCQKHYGVASREFLRMLIRGKDAEISNIKDLRQSLQQYLPKGADGQVNRAFNRFCLIAIAGELATSFGITGWEKGEAVAGVMKCFNDWLRSRGGVGLHEEKASLSQVRKFFEQHGESRFSRLDGDETKTINRVGYRGEGDDGMEFYVFKESFKTEICVGLDSSFVAKLCVRHGLLMPDSEGKPTRAERLPSENKKTTRCYRFTSKVLFGEE